MHVGGGGDQAEGGTRRCPSPELLYQTDWMEQRDIDLMGFFMIINVKRLLSSSFSVCVFSPRKEMVYR